jgi:hypothetical protein
MTTKYSEYEIRQRRSPHKEKKNKALCPKCKKYKLGYNRFMCPNCQRRLSTQNNMEGDAVYCHY